MEVLNSSSRKASSSTSPSSLSISCVEAVSPLLLFFTLALCQVKAGVAAAVVTSLLLFFSVLMTTILLGVVSLFFLPFPLPSFLSSFFLGGLPH